MGSVVATQIGDDNDGSRARLPAKRDSTGLAACGLAESAQVSFKPVTPGTANGENNFVASDLLHSTEPFSALLSSVLFRIEP